MIAAARAGKKLDGANQHLFRDSAAGETSAGEAFLFGNSDFRAERVCRFHRIQPGRAATDNE
jgi:hypothetical protein